MTPRIYAIDPTSNFRDAPFYVTPQTVAAFHSSARMAPYTGPAETGRRAEGGAVKVTKFEHSEVHEVEPEMVQVHDAEILGGLVGQQGLTAILVAWRP